MKSRAVWVALVSLAACTDADAPCREESLQPIAAPATVEEERYNTALEILRVQLHTAVGQYVDGSLPAYRGAVRVVQTLTTDEGEQRTEVAGLAHAVLFDDLENLDDASDGSRVPVRKFQFHLPTADFQAFLIQDPRAPGVTLYGGGGTWDVCRGSVTPFDGSPEGMVLTDVVCERDGEGADVRLEVHGAFERRDPAELDFADLLYLREIGVRGRLSAVDQPAPHTGIIEAVEHNVFYENIVGQCHDAIIYKAVLFVDTRCLGTGVAELEIESAQRCCCGHAFCHPDECETL